MPARRKRAGKAVRPTKAAAARLVALCVDTEEVLNEAVDAARATHLVGHGLGDFVGEHEASAVAASAWATC